MDFKLPELGEGVNEGELVKWRVAEGEEVTHDQPLCEVMTDKATIEVPSPFAGKVTGLKVNEGDTAEVGQVMLTYEGEGASASSSAPQAETTPAAAPAASAASAPAAPQPAIAASAPSSVESRVPAAPSTRRYAREQGVDLSSVAATGPAGRVLREDVDRFISGAGATAGGSPQFVSPVGRAAPTQAEERIPFKGLRKKISEKMRLSKDQAAHFTYVEEADATNLVKLRKYAKEVGAEKGIKVTYLPFIMKAMAAVLRDFPIMNSSLDEASGEIVLKHYFNIGLSIQTDDGLTAPVVKNVENKSILELAAEIQDLVERARNKQLQLADFEGGTITLTNAGSIGGLFATPVINYPEVAILGFNKIFRKPVVKMVKGKEKLVVRDWTYFSISLDHRIVDGAIGAQFMNQFVKVIEEPSLMML